MLVTKSSRELRPFIAWPVDPGPIVAGEPGSLYGEPGVCTGSLSTVLRRPAKGGLPGKGRGLPDSKSDSGKWLIHNG